MLGVHFTLNFTTSLLIWIEPQLGPLERKSLTAETRPLHVQPSYPLRVQVHPCRHLVRPCLHQVCQCHHLVHQILLEELHHQLSLQTGLAL